MTTTALIKESTYLGLTYSFRGFRGLARCNSVQADLVLEKELRILHLDSQVTGSELSPTPDAA